MKTFASLILILSLVSCSTRPFRGSIAHKHDEKRGILCMNSDEVKVGDKLDLMKNECQKSENGEEVSCEKKKVGVVKIIRLLDDNYSEFKVSGDARFSTENFVEGRSR